MGVRVDAIGVVVRDMSEAMAFYGRLGCAFPPDAGPPHAVADLGGVSLMFDTVESLVELGFSDGDETGPRRGVALAARCDSPAELDALYAAFAADGFGRLEPFDAPWGQRYATLADPDGTQVDLYAALE